MAEMWGGLLLGLGIWTARLIVDGLADLLRWVWRTP